MFEESSKITHMMLIRWSHFYSKIWCNCQNLQVKRQQEEKRPRSTDETDFISTHNRNNHLLVLWGKCVKENELVWRCARGLGVWNSMQCWRILHIAYCNDYIFGVWSSDRTVLSLGTAYPSGTQLTNSSWAITAKQSQQDFGFSVSGAFYQ